MLNLFFAGSSLSTTNSANTIQDENENPGNIVRRVCYSHISSTSMKSATELVSSGIKTFHSLNPFTATNSYWYCTTPLGRYKSQMSNHWHSPMMMMIVMNSPSLITWNWDIGDAFHAMKTNLKFPQNQFWCSSARLKNPLEELMNGSDFPLQLFRYSLSWTRH